MDAIILVGGKGTRLQKTIGLDTPKPLALINGRPFLDILIQRLENFQIIKNIILAVGYKKEKIIDRYKDKKNILFSEESSPLGTGGAIKKAIKLSQSKEILVLNGDTYLEFSPSDLLKAHNETKADITIVCRFEKNMARYGCISIETTTQKIISFDEKVQKENGYINSGIYVMNNDVFNDYESVDSFSIEKDFFAKILKIKNTFAYVIDCPFIDIGTDESYHRAQNILNLG
ncbi:MAG: D-glycero-alpha-D-manno-heptose 1-phosphate guanylyltransferase [Candidatus Anoxychlamydiales bacterium]|nr:D-glycero-alpha-D-manno-heptose 1-phosphate guanylyltransferase [Candidatus Anoxychlamydiales bacterium]NGX36033.1 D-glycero-alpha-D-manno-heptose 1-phosphate guanylyltransferase [Candidatus Anoxychlamydiales bacterium]